MKILKVLDEGGYTERMPVIKRQVVRAIIVKDGRIAMQRSKTGEYKIPGGGLEAGEGKLACLCREVREEIGRIIIEDSVKELGETIEYRADKYEKNKKFERYTYYYLCDVTDEEYPLMLTQSEKDMGFKCVFETPEKIYESNKELCTSPYVMRDTVFIKMILDGEVSLKRG